MKKINLTAVITNMILSLLLVSCFNHSSNSAIPNDLSFAGITIGQEFPDSLKGSFKYYNVSGILPGYEGIPKFSLPNYPKPEMYVVASTDVEEKEVVCITIMINDLKQACDFYNMLKSKYGLPTSSYGNTDCTLQRLLCNVYEQLGLYNNQETDISGSRVIATWRSTGYPSDIVLKARTYHYPYSVDSDPTTHFEFYYVNIAKHTQELKKVEARKNNEKREEYKNDNLETMGQDF